MKTCDIKTCVMCYQGECIVSSSYRSCPYTQIRQSIEAAKFALGVEPPLALHIGQSRWMFTGDRLPTEEGMYLLCSDEGDISVRYFNPKADVYNMNGLSLFKTPGARYWLRLFIPEVPVKGECEI